MKKAFKILLGVLLVLLMLLAANGCGGQQADDKKEAAQEQKQEGKKIVVRFSHSLPEKHPRSLQFQEWADLATKKAAGTLEVQIYPAAQLYKDVDVVEAVTVGGIESGLLYSFILEKMIPQFQVLSVPFLFDNNTDLLYGFLSNLETKERLCAAMEKKGIKPIAWILEPHEGFGIMWTKEVKVPADARGLTVRGVGPPQVAYFKKWGVNPSFLSGAELYMALQRGVIQGAYGAVTAVVERKLYEVAPYYTLLPIGTVASVIGMNKSFFDKLSPQLQQAILDAGKEVESKTVARAKADWEVTLKEAQEKGIKIYQPTPEEMKLWMGDVEKTWQEIYKDDPQVLADIEEVLQLKAKYKNP